MSDVAKLGPLKLGTPTDWVDNVTALNQDNLNKNSDAINRSNTALTVMHSKINEIIEEGVGGAAVQIVVWEDE